MLILKVGTRLKERELANKYISDNFDVENKKIILKRDELKAIPQNFETNLFGEKSVIYLEDWNQEDYRDDVYRYLEDIRDSQNLFVIDEPEMLDATFNKLCKYAYKDTIFDAREEKIKESAFYFGDLFLMRKKQEAWTEYLRLLKVGEPVESIAGALLYKIKVSRMSVNLKTEFMYKIMSIIALDHDGKLKAEIEFEKLILSL